MSALDIGPTGRYLLDFRYLDRTPDGDIVEAPEELFDRVAHAIAQAEPVNRTAWAERFLELMTSFAFLPNAPALLGAGRPQGQLHACFVLPVEDSVNGIFDALRMAAVVHSKGGGTGFSFSGVRGRGSPIATGGTSTGAVSFLRLFDAETEVIRQGGTGWGANMGTLRFDHADVEEFVAAKSSGGGLRNFNLSVGVTDAFMARPTELLDFIAHEAWRGGDPGLLFLDRIERDNPVPALGPLEATNPCGEAPLLPFEACCLGGLNVARFVEDGTVRWDDLRAAAALALRILDDVIDVSRYPLPEIERATRRTRKVGIGVMGFADALISLGVPYDSTQAERMAAAFMEAIAEATREASARLAHERGSYPAFGLSARHERGGEPVRNATTTANAPNSTIGPIAGCSPGIEPLFALAYTRRHRNGDRLLEVHPAFERAARERGCWSAELQDEVARRGSIRSSYAVPADLARVFATAHDVSPEWHVRIQAAFQRHTDLGISKTINLPGAATPADVRAAFEQAHALGCKGVTVFRDGCRDEQFLDPTCEVCA